MKRAVCLSCNARMFWCCTKAVCYSDCLVSRPIDIRSNCRSTPRRDLFSPTVLQLDGLIGCAWFSPRVVNFSPPARFPRCRVARRRATRVGRPRARSQRDANPTRGSPSRTSTARRGFRGARAASGVESPRDSASPGSAVHAESRGPGTGFLCWEGRRGPERA